MGKDTVLKTQIHETVEQLEGEQLKQLWNYLAHLQTEPEDALYPVSEHAGEANVSNVAEAGVIYRQDQRPGHPLVAEMTVPQLEGMIYDVVERVLFETSYDPDEGLELREDFVEKLERSIAEEKEGKTIPLEEVVERLGLEW